MKYLILFSFLTYSLLTFSQSKQVVRKIQISFIVDASSSNSEYLDAAKFQIWNLMNELKTVQLEKKTTSLEIALYEMANDNISSEVSFVRQLSFLSTDLSFVSRKLFEISPNGGLEFYDAAIMKNINELDWSINPKDLKMIFIIGNESFNQGVMNYKTVCEIAKDRQISINTVYCGSKKEGIKELWSDAATVGGGDFFNIELSQHSSLKTDVDHLIKSFNDSLSKTYYGNERANREKQSVIENQIKKKKTKPSSNFTSNIDSVLFDIDDLIDEDREGNTISKLDASKLPAEFKNNTYEQQIDLIEKKRKNRNHYKNKLSELEKQRQQIVSFEIMKGIIPIKNELQNSLMVSIQKQIVFIANLKE